MQIQELDLLVNRRLTTVLDPRERISHLLRTASLTWDIGMVWESVHACIAKEEDLMKGINMLRIVVKSFCFLFFGLSTAFIPKSPIL